MNLSTAYCSCIKRFSPYKKTQCSRSTWDIVAILNKDSPYKNLQTFSWICHINILIVFSSVFKHNYFSFTYLKHGICKNWGFCIFNKIQSFVAILIFLIFQLESILDSKTNESHLYKRNNINNFSACCWVKTQRIYPIALMEERYSNPQKGRTVLGFQDITICYYLTVLNIDISVWIFWENL